MGHLTEIPPGLKERWEAFTREVKACWKEAHRKYPEGPAEKLFEAYFECMRKGAYHDITYEKAIAAGIEPHPLCVIAKMVKGMSESEAREQCLREGKYHGISVIRARLEGLV